MLTLGEHRLYRHLLDQGFTDHQYDEISKRILKEQSWATLEALDIRHQDVDAAEAEFFRITAITVPDGQWANIEESTLTEAAREALNVVKAAKFGHRNVTRAFLYKTPQRWLLDYITPNALVDFITKFWAEPGTGNDGQVSPCTEYWNATLKQMLPREYTEWFQEELRAAGLAYKCYNCPPSAMVPVPANIAQHILTMRTWDQLIAFLDSLTPEAD